ncbi:dTDP-4-dehydrorhamnose 3,5-epimerase family protein [uncultured Jannaschia sp.]|uniref:dTDP-4-dehydrorhamnose 3,5-epimerase family protein n=1 Tax=uncultured Jannaschia sp. TaxID=293347 RepID=UPI00261A20FE|nr:dTDP-4-dehydrorhamnose 3,5-epimerase family protein [uncultured Jannaschia sp.]
MIFDPLPIASAFEVRLEPRRDARGLFARVYCDDEFRAEGLVTDWVQMNISVTIGQGIIRGLHFQAGPVPEAKLVRCLSGRAHDVILDLRAGSATYGRHAAITLDAEDRNAVYVPPGVAHGFQTLTPDVELQYLHSARYAPDHEGGVDALDPALGLDWPLPPAMRSDRDRNLPPLAEVDPL